MTTIQHTDQTSTTTLTLVTDIGGSLEAAVVHDGVYQRDLYSLSSRSVFVRSVIATVSWRNKEYSNGLNATLAVCPLHSPCAVPSRSGDSHVQRRHLRVECASAPAITQQFAQTRASYVFVRDP